MWQRLFRPCGLGVCLLAGSALGSPADTPAPGKPALESRLRRPTALVLADNGKWLYTANRASGSVSVIDTGSLRTVAEVRIGRYLSDLAITPDGRRLVATDEGAGELVLMGRQGATLTVLRRLKVSPALVGVQVAEDGTRCFVASLWSRWIFVVELAPEPRVARVIALPFAPRELLPVRGGAKLIVADSFGGQLGVVDVRRGELESVRTLPAHNIRGLALGPDEKELLVTHQVLNGLAHTTQDEIHWGNLMTNDLRILPLAGVLTPRADLLRGSRVIPLGEADRGAGDPAGVAATSDGTIVVALAGVGQVTWGRPADLAWQRLDVGRRPTALVADPDGRRVYVANTFSDSVSVVDLARAKVTAEIGLGPQPDLSLSDRGELLFYDARLSHDGWFSCHSCHTDGHSNGRLNDNLGDGSFGAPKRVLSLLGVKDTGPWAWNGGMPDLQSQVRKSILTTMHGRAPPGEQIEALTAFLRTLSPPPPVMQPAGEADEAMVRRGREVCHRAGCAGCHAPPTFTSRQTYDVGLADEVGNTRFNPPSLRGVSQRGPYFHDGRAVTLEEVFTRHRHHQLTEELLTDQLADLLRFLRSL
jgi:YVTN family beta-propeller protein